MNFNLTGNPEYSLFADMTDELIKLYGIACRFLIVQRINQDLNVFGDYSHIKTDNSKAFDIYALPETSESMDNSNYGFSQFGFSTTESTALFVSKATMELMFPNIYESKGVGGVLGNIVILPCGGLLEVTDCTLSVPGVSNLFVNTENKNVYKLTCITYNNKMQNEIDPVQAAGSNFVTLENYFNELVADNEAIETAAAVTKIPGTSKVIVPPIDSVFGRF